METVRDALKLPYAAIALGETQADRFVAADAGAPAATTLHMPLAFRGAAVGELRLAPRTPGQECTSRDLALLDDFARPAGVAAHAVALTAQLRHARRRLIAAREEERRRLRRDLHDGLGPALASQILSLDAAGLLVRSDPDRAQALLEGVREQVKDAVGDVRRLIYDLRPPVLDDRGLAAAVREQAAGAARGGLKVVVHAPERLPDLPAAVETAAYRIVGEALANVVRHAGATSCDVHLACGDAALLVEVRDDGRGLQPDRPSGVGLASMRERATELGGTCSVKPHDGGGTVVCAMLPLGDRA